MILFWSFLKLICFRCCFCCWCWRRCDCSLNLTTSNIHKMIMHTFKMFQQMLHTLKMFQQMLQGFQSVYDHFVGDRRHRLKGMVNVKCRNTNDLLYWKKNCNSKLLQWGEYSLKESARKLEVLTSLVVLYSDSKE